MADVPLTLSVVTPVDSLGGDLQTSLAGLLPYYLNGRTEQGHENRVVLYCVWLYTFDS